MTYSHDFDACLKYRIAFGLACNLREEGGHSLSSRASRLSPREFDALLDDVARRANLSADDEAVRDGVSDAIEGRKPRW